METSFDFDHYDKPGDPWHKSKNVSFTLTDKGADVVISSAIRDSSIELPTAKFTQFNSHFDQPGNQDLITSVKAIHASGRGGEIEDVVRELGKVEFSWIGDDDLGGSNMNQGDYHSGPAGYSPNTAYPDTQYGSGFDEGDWR